MGDWFKCKFFTSCGLLFYVIITTESLIVRRHFHDGILYEDYTPDSENVRYSMTKGQGWDDLNKLAKTNNLTAKSMFCTRGVGGWLLYPETGFGFGIKSRELILVSGESCQPVDQINSIQPLGPLNFKLVDTNAVVGFTEKYFASSGKILGNGSESAKSLIFLGEGAWTVTGGDKAICVTSKSGNGGICLVEDTEIAFSSSSLTISLGCGDDENMEKYGLQSCYSKGMNKIPYAFDFLLPAMQQVCSGGYDESDDVKHKFFKVMDVFTQRFRQMESVTNNDELPDTIDKMRHQVVSLLFDIMGSCKSADDGYLQIVEYIYYQMHLQNGAIWDKQEETNSTEGVQYQTATMLEFLSTCNEKVGSGVGPTYKTECTPKDISLMKTPEEIETLDEFLSSDFNDFVIEQVWLILNYANAYCNTLLGHKDNFWVEFPIIFKRDFMYPIREQWKDPGRWVTYYPLMFMGFDLNFQRKQMIGCLQEAIIRTPFYDPLSRPPEFYEGGNTTAIRDVIGKPKKPANEDDKTNRRKRQRKASSESDEIQVQQINSNKLEPYKVVQRTTPLTTVPTLTSSTIEAFVEATTKVTPIDQLETATSNKKHHKKKGKKVKRKKNKDRHGKNKTGKKHSKLLRRTKEETTIAQEDFIPDSVTENIILNT